MRQDMTVALLIN